MSTVRAKVIDALEDQILKGKFNNGEILPSERDLAAEFGVGRASLREALRELKERGLIDIRPGRGTFVARPDSTRAVSGIALWATRSGVTPADVLDARIALESKSAMGAAANPDHKAIALLEKILHELEAEKNPSRLARLDVAFHLVIARLSGNPVYELLLTSLAPLTADLVASTSDKIAVISRRSKEHRKIANAIRDGNQEEAGKAMIEHLSSGEETLPHFHEPMNAKGLIPDTTGLDALLSEEKLGSWSLEK